MIKQLKKSQPKSNSIKYKILAHDSSKHEPIRDFERERRRKGEPGGQGKREEGRKEVGTTTKRQRGRKEASTTTKRM